MLWSHYAAYYCYLEKVRDFFLLSQQVQVGFKASREVSIKHHHRFVLDNKFTEWKIFLKKSHLTDSDRAKPLFWFRSKPKPKPNGFWETETETETEANT